MLSKSVTFWGHNSPENVTLRRIQADPLAGRLEFIDMNIFDITEIEKKKTSKLWLCFPKIFCVIDVHLIN